MSKSWGHEISAMTTPVEPPNPRLEGWHWLKRRDSGTYRMAFWRPPYGWRVADRIGRMTIRNDRVVAQIFTYHARVPAP